MRASYDGAAGGGGGYTYKPIKLRIALQGGGTLGAYAAGVLEALAQHPEIQIVEGTCLSAGAVNLHTFSHAGVDGLNTLWNRIGSNGDEANRMDPFNLRHAIPASYLSAMFSVPGIATPLSHLRSAIEDSIATHRNRSAKINLHISTATKIDPRGDLSINNVREVIHTSKDHSLDTVLASSALHALTELEPRRNILIDGVPHWDGVYSGINPNMNMYARRVSDSPVLVVTVDERKHKRSITDDHIMYGPIHQDIMRLRAMGKSPVYNVGLKHQAHWPDRVRVHPSSGIINELRETGLADGHAIAQQIIRDMVRKYTADLGVGVRDNALEVA